MANYKLSYEVFYILTSKIISVFKTELIKSPLVISHTQIYLSVLADIKYFPS